MPKLSEPHDILGFYNRRRIARHSDLLPNDRRGQERQVAQTFSDQLYQSAGRKVKVLDFEPAEADHDAYAQEGSDRIQIQIAELWPDDCLTEGESGDYQLDERAWEQALANAIQKKFDHHYVKPEKDRLWLVVFSTVPYETVSYQGEMRYTSTGLDLAVVVAHQASGLHPFDEIWHTDLVSQAVRVYPFE
jgi:hypothetical protein